MLGVLNLKKRGYLGYFKYGMRLPKSFLFAVEKRISVHMPYVPEYPKKNRSTRKKTRGAQEINLDNSYTPMKRDTRDFSVTRAQRANRLCRHPFSHIYKDQ